MDDSGHSYRKIVAGYVSRGQGAGPLHVTDRGGLFEAEGLDVEIRLIDGSAKQSVALMSGEVRFGVMAAPGALPTMLAGGDLVFVTSGINQQFVIGRPGTSELKDVAGGLIGIHNRGELTDLFARIITKIVQAQGLPGMTIVEGLDQHECIDGLVNCTIDAAVLSPPAANEARRRGCAWVFDFKDCGLNYTLGGIVTRRKTITEHPQLVRQFIRAYVAGMHLYKTDREFAVDVQRDYSGIEDRTLAEETYNTTSPGMPRAPYPVTTGLSRLLQEYEEIDPRAGSVDVEGLVEASFIFELDKSGYIENLYR